MKTRLLVFALSLMASPCLFGQTADTLVGQGRGFLAQQDALNAKAKFEAALAIAPNHPDANGLLAVARLLALGNTPEGGALLDRLGFSATGRNTFNWRSDVPRDTNGVWLTPSNFSAAELSAFIRSNVIPALRASETNFSRITNTAYTLLLSSAETSLENVTVDYGDVQMLRSLLTAGVYLSYTIYSWNLDVQLTVIRDFVTNDTATIQQFLAANPLLFTFATTNDLLTARSDFLAAAERYFAASAFIRARPQNTDRLFNLDPNQAANEADFRQTLADVTNSLSSPVVLVVDTNLTVYLAKHFSGQTSPRSLFPAFYGDAFIVGSLPDPTFGGLIQGWPQSASEAVLAEYLPAAIPLWATMLQAPRRYYIQFSTLTNHPYALEASSNLTAWASVAEFVATGTNYNYLDTSVTNRTARFFRLVDLSQYLSVAGQVVDACSGLPLSNALVTTTLDAKSAVTDAAGNFFIQTRVLPSFMSFAVVAQAGGHTPATNSFWAGSDRSELVLALSPTSSSVPVNDSFDNRITLSGSSPTGAGTTCGATLEAGEPAANGGSVWWTWTSPFTGSVQIQVKGTCYSPRVDVYVGILGALTNVGSGYSSVSFSATAGQRYQLRFSVNGAPNAFQFTLFSPPQLNLTSPVSGTILSAPADVLFSATFTTPTATLREVEFYANSELIGTATNTPINFLWTGVRPGAYSLSVRARDSAGRQASAGTSITVRPGNDNFANRTPLAGTNLLVTGDNTSATSESGEPIHGGVSSSRSVWWSWTAPSSGPVTVTAIGDEAYADNASFLGIYTGSVVSNLTLVACNAYGTPFGSQTSFNATADVAYQIAVAGWYGGKLELAVVKAAAPVVTLLSPTNGQVFIRGQSITLQASATDSDGTIQNVSFSDDLGILGSDTTSPYSWLLTSSATEGYYSVSATALDGQGLIGYSPEVYFEVWPPAPTNDNFSNRLVLTGSFLTATGYNWSATKQVGEPNHAGNPGGASTWWTWTSPSNSIVTISTLGSGFDTLLGVYQGTNVAALTLVASNDNDGFSATSLVNFNVTNGHTYQIAVDGFNDGASVQHGNITLNLGLAAPDASLADAFDATGLTWISGGNAVWTRQTAVTHDGVDAGQSGTITDNQESWVQTNIVGPGSGSFWWRVSSESGYDYLRFSVDGIQQSAISGSTAWINYPFTLGSGSHTLRWRYTKDDIVSAGSDKGWVDQVTFGP